MRTTEIPDRRRRLVSLLTPKQAAEYTLETLVEHYEWCLLDFLRFMAGWGLWGAAGWCEQRTRPLLDRISLGDLGACRV